MTTTTATGHPVATSAAVRNGATIMAVAAAKLMGYAVLFLVRNFTSSFLELGIGHNEVNVGKDQIQQFSPSLYHYISHLQIALSGFIAATGLAVLLLAIYGVAPGRCGPGSPPSPPQCSPWRGYRAARPLPLEPRHPWPPRAHLPGHAGVRGRRTTVRQGPAGRQTDNGSF